MGGWSLRNHAMGVAALAALERDRDHLSALGVVAEAGRIRHADEFELDQRLVDLERLRHELAQLPRIRAVRDDEKFAMIEPIWPDRISRARQRHRERPLAHFLLFHFSFLADRCQSFRVAVRCRSRRCERPPACPAARIFLHDSGCERRRGIRRASALPSSAGRTRSPWHCPHISLRDRSAERCCRPFYSPRRPAWPPREDRAAPREAARARSRRRCVAFVRTCRGLFPPAY